MSKREKHSNYWPKLRTSGDAEAWAYLSKSGRTLEIYVRPTEYGDAVLPSPVIVKFRVADLGLRSRRTK